MKGKPIMKFMQTAPKETLITEFIQILATLNNRREESKRVTPKC